MLVQWPVRFNASRRTDRHVVFPEFQIPGPSSSLVWVSAKNSCDGQDILVPLVICAKRKCTAMARILTLMLILLTFKANHSLRTLDHMSGEFFCWALLLILGFTSYQKTFHVYALD